METVARAGGRIEALCVDEGFGALDRANLERAVEGLRGAGAEDRLVLLVSHVQGVAAAAADVILVERTGRGASTARRLGEAEREALADPEGGGEAVNLLQTA